MGQLTIYVDDLTEAALKRCAAALGRDWGELAEAAVADAAIRNDPGPAPDHGAPPRPPRTPEDTQTVTTPEQGQPVITRKDPA
ncbi:MAG: hypothetical protein Q8S03_10325 [Brevundimonas sp.]|uniref:hypothetical protein n=1 Tax=Brevundimonas sp. TaxID=1871086 RepID=UPI0027336E38|nr:hypothetical protein [Brevundimonas sp.]MDP3405075.1 hypothetical protein [Brevundimonas sp.]